MYICAYRCISLVKGQLSCATGGMSKYNLLLSCAFVGRKKDLLSPTLLLVALSLSLATPAAARFVSTLDL